MARLVNHIGSVVTPDHVRGFKLWISLPETSIGLLLLCGVHQLLGCRIIIDVLCLDVLRLIPSTAEASDEAYKKSYGVDDVDNADQGSNAKQKDTGDH